MTRSFETLLFHKEEGVAHITLDRPHVLNAYNTQMRDDLWLALEAVRDDQEVGAVVLAGAGERGFCAGADLTEFGGAPSQAVARQVRFERDVWGLLLSLRVPVVAALHGYVLGAGLEMALLCDVRIASDDAEFGLPEAALGMAPPRAGAKRCPVSSACLRRWTCCSAHAASTLRRRSGWGWSSTSCRASGFVRRRPRWPSAWRPRLEPRWPRSRRRCIEARTFPSTRRWPWRSAWPV